jgi:hypothetical protein
MLRREAIDIDARKTAAQAQFWAAALGWRLSETDENGEVGVEPPVGGPEEGVVPELLFLPVPENKAVQMRGQGTEGSRG